MKYNPKSPVKNNLHIAEVKAMLEKCKKHYPYPENFYMNLTIAQLYRMCNRIGSNKSKETAVSTGPKYRDLYLDDRYVCTVNIEVRRYTIDGVVYRVTDSGALIELENCEKEEKR